MLRNTSIATGSFRMKQGLLISSWIREALQFPGLIWLAFKHECKTLYVQCPRSHGSRTKKEYTFDEHPHITAYQITQLLNYQESK